MASGWRRNTSIFRIGLQVAIVFLFAPVISKAAQAQTYNVIYTFTGDMDGASPEAGVTIDRRGRLYGTTESGGNGFGTVFQLTQTGSSWTLNPLYDFQGRSDGYAPQARVVFGPDGNLYGTTRYGGVSGFGNVFKLTPPATVCKTVLCHWTETLLYSFTGGVDGAYPMGDLIFDQLGNIYGTAASSGMSGSHGSVYKLTHSGGSWMFSILYAFSTGLSVPKGGVIFDSAGNLYGTAQDGGEGCGARGCGGVFELTPSGSGWLENDLYLFQGGNDGYAPTGGLIFDNAGNLYGTTSLGGTGGGGTVFSLTPSGQSWTFSLLHSFSGSDDGPLASLVMDMAGALYGTTSNDGAHGVGNVFKLARSGGGWTYTSLYDFTDGGTPLLCVLQFDANGNIYGTTASGGRGAGVVFKITP